MRTDTHSRIVRLEQRLRRGNEQLQVAVNVDARRSSSVGRRRWTREHNPSIADEEVHEIDLTPLVHINERPAQPPVVLVQQVQPSRADRIERNSDADNGERRLVLQKRRDDLDELRLVSRV